MRRRLSRRSDLLLIANLFFYLILGHADKEEYFKIVNYVLRKGLIRKGMKGPIVIRSPAALCAERVIDFISEGGIFLESLASRIKSSSCTWWLALVIG